MTRLNEKRQQDTVEDDDGARPRENAIRRDGETSERKPSRSGYATRRIVLSQSTAGGEPARARIQRRLLALAPSC